MKPRKIIHALVQNADDFEIPKEDIIHTERILVEGEFNMTIPMLEIWYLE